MTKCLKYPLHKHHLPNGQVTQGLLAVDLLVGLLVINRLKTNKQTEEQNYQDIS